MKIFHKMYAAGFILFLLDIFSFAFIGNFHLHQYFAYLSMPFFASGMIFYIYDFYVKNKNKWYMPFKWKSLLIVFHVAIWFLSSIYAKTFFSAALDLPADGFDTSIILIAAVFYPVTWMIVVSIFFRIDFGNFNVLFFLFINERCCGKYDKKFKFQ